MFTNYIKLRLIVFALLSFSLMGCNSTPGLTEVINIPSEKWRITNIVVSNSDDGWRVSGRLNSPNNFGLPDGNIVVSILSENGTLLDKKTANYRRIIGNAGRHRRHQFGVALFSINFDSIPENAKVVAEQLIEKKR